MSSLFLEVVNKEVDDQLLGMQSDGFLFSLEGQVIFRMSTYPGFPRKDLVYICFSSIIISSAPFHF